MYWRSWHKLINKFIKVTMIWFMSYYGNADSSPGNRFSWLLKWLWNSDGVQNTLPGLHSALSVFKGHIDIDAFPPRHKQHPLNCSALYPGNSLQTIVFTDLLAWIDYARTKSFSQNSRVFMSLETEQMYSLQANVNPAGILKHLADELQKGTLLASRHGDISISSSLSTQKVQSSWTGEAVSRESL